MECLSCFILYTMCTLSFISMLPSLASGKKFRWCTLSDAEQRKCSYLARTLQSVLPANDAFSRVSCVRAHNTQDCMTKIRGNKADAVSLDAGEVYTAIQLYDLAAVAKEQHSEGSCVFAVAVARRGTLSIDSLRGTRSCHSGARWTSGWNIPLGFLLSKNFLYWDEKQPLSKVVSRYFNASCIPGIGISVPNLCELCQGPKSYVRDKNNFCETSSSEPFSGTDGAFRCLKSGAGDVAFMDHLSIINATDSELEAFELLCPDGSTAPLSSFRKCNLGQGPNKAIVTRGPLHRITKRFLTLIQGLFGRNGRQRNRFSLFASDPFGGQNLLFYDTTQKLQVLNDDVDMAGILGLDYVALLKGLGHEGISLDNSVVRWCCISAAEMRKCEDWALNVRSDPLVCIQATSPTGCIEMIKRNEADAVSLDATHAYIAGRCGLQPAAVEYWGEISDCVMEPEENQHNVSGRDFPPLYALAITKKTTRAVTLSGMGQRRSCHGYLYSPAGWLLLSKHTVRTQGNKTWDCDINLAYENYFWKGCMPGAERDLCKVCVGWEEDGRINGRCAANHDERYYGNMGALRCLVGDPAGRSFGDVAFLEHHSLQDNIANLEKTGWAHGFSTSDFELLCPNDGRAALAEWRSCNLGTIPPSVVMTRPVITAKVYDFLVKSQESLGLGKGSMFQLFQSAEVYGEGDLLFKESTSCLRPIGSLSLQDILGESFMNLAHSVFDCTQAGILDFCKKDMCTDSKT
ncbi:serotransferrin-2-like [Spea bombifrons]|uniref:serotransferrin-2-like n=1 Tax=Spea bombifrons TaxID=233779 RepID=UPI0023495AEA|nr:serotransferrin-2-like [Spea bombifrons]